MPLRGQSPAKGLPPASFKSLFSAAASVLHPSISPNPDPMHALGVWPSASTGSLPVARGGLGPRSLLEHPAPRTTRDKTDIRPESLETGDWAKGP